MRKILNKEVFTFAFPSMVEMVLISLITVIDNIMVSGLGKTAISATAITSNPRFVLIAPVLALNIGISILIARRRGENNSADTNLYAHNALMLSFIFSIIVSVVGFVFAREILQYAGASKDYIDLAVSYFEPVMMGNVFYTVSLTISSIKRGLGKARDSLNINLTSNIIKVILNYILINGIFFKPLGVLGAGYATLIGNIISFAISMATILPQGRFVSFNFKYLALRKSIVSKILSVSKVALIEQVIFRLSYFYGNKIFASLGTLAFSTHVQAMNIIQVTYAFGEGLSVAASALVGRSLGEKKPEQAYKYSVDLQKIGLIISITIALITAFFHKELFSILSQNDIDIIIKSQEILILLVVTILLQISQIIIIGSLRGAGDVKFIAYLMLFSVAFVRLCLSYVFVRVFNGGLTGAWLAIALDQLIRNVISYLRFRKREWMNITI